MDAKQRIRSIPMEGGIWTRDAKQRIRSIPTEGGIRTACPASKQRWAHDHGPAIDRCKYGKGFHGSM